MTRRGLLVNVMHISISQIPDSQLKEYVEHVSPITDVLWPSVSLRNSFPGDDELAEFLTEFSSDNTLHIQADGRIKALAVIPHQLDPYIPRSMTQVEISHDDFFFCRMSVSQILVVVIVAEV